MKGQAGRQRVQAVDGDIGITDDGRAVVRCEVFGQGGHRDRRIDGGNGLPGDLRFGLVETGGVGKALAIEIALLETIAVHQTKTADTDPGQHLGHVPPQSTNPHDTDRAVEQAMLIFRAQAGHVADVAFRNNPHLKGALLHPTQALVEVPGQLLNDRR